MAGAGLAIASTLLVASTPLAFAQQDATDDLRERLTEREDENRLEQPLTFDFLGRPLIVSGQWESAGDFIDATALGEDSTGASELLLDSELESELFYSFGKHLSLFAQLRLIAGNDLRRNTPDSGSDFFVERGEMWLNSQDIAGTGANLDIGRLDFEDDRWWWWDTELDAVRLSRESGPIEITVAAARELAAARTNLGYIEPDHDRVVRRIAEASWDWAEQHSLQAFAMQQRDHSPIEAIGRLVQAGREDESDADLAWYGLRSIGAWSTDRAGVIGYWLDSARVKGRETLLEFEEATADASRVTGNRRQSVEGWAIDAGFTWILPLPADPRFSAGLARGSGDRHPGDGVDRTFHQTGLQSNEIGFGGVERFVRYGNLLDPELSNLTVITIGTGVSILDSSSIDLVYHRYRLVELADSLRNTRIDSQLTGEDRDVGQALDLIVAIEEGQRTELQFVGSTLRPGSAFGAGRKPWVWGGFLALRIAF